LGGDDERHTHSIQLAEKNVVEQMRDPNSSAELRQLTQCAEAFLAWKLLLLRTRFFLGGSLTLTVVACMVCMEGMHT
jgi:hypothetical protein